LQAGAHLTYMNTDAVTTNGRRHTCGRATLVCDLATFTSSSTAFTNRSFCFTDCSSRESLTTSLTRATSPRICISRNAPTGLPFLRLPSTEGARAARKCRANRICGMLGYSHGLTKSLTRDFLLSSASPAAFNKQRAVDAGSIRIKSARSNCLSPGETALNRVITYVSKSGTF